jgi:hypothetical protein
MSSRGITQIYNGGLSSGSGRKEMKMTKGDKQIGLDMSGYGHSHRSSGSGAKRKSGGRRRRSRK